MNPFHCPGYDVRAPGVTLKRVFSLTSIPLSLILMFVHTPNSLLNVCNSYLLVTMAMLIMLAFLSNLFKMVRERCVNPFFSRIEFQKSEYLSLILGSIFLAPIRFVVAFLGLCFCSALARFFLYVLTFIDREKEPEKFHWWRNIFKRIVMLFFRSSVFFCGFYDLRITQKGDPTKEVDAPIIVLAPHTSMFDIFCGLSFGGCASVAKADTATMPLFGNIFMMTDPVLVERDSKDSRQSVFDKVRSTIKYSKIVFFPEGTCTNRKGLLQFKNGAFKFGYPVLPTAVRFNQHSSANTMSWTWDGPHLLVSFWYTLARWRTSLELVKLPVYYPSEEEKLNPDLFALNVTKVIEKELNIPSVLYSYDDVKYLKYKFFRSSTCIKFVKLCDKVRPYRSNKDSETPINNKGVNLNNSNKIASETLFTQFLKDYLVDVQNNLAKLDPQTEVTQSLLIDVLEAASVPGISKSYSVSELLTCLQKCEQKPTVLHLSLILDLIDLHVEDLWERLRHAYNKMTHNDEVKLSQMDVKALLWYALNLENIDDDEEMKDMFILSFDDLKNAIITYYWFALRENAPSIYREEYRPPT